MIDFRRNGHGERRLRVFTWPVHGSYFYYLSQCNCDFFLPVDSRRNGAYGGAGDGSAYAVGANVHNVAVEDIPSLELDAILFQSQAHFEQDQYEIFSEAQRRLPKIVVEHDPPRDHPTDMRHWLRDPSATLVHVTDFNRLMWDNGDVPTTVIDHGIVDPGYHYEGTLEKGIVVINNLGGRGRRLGLDIYEQVRKRVPVELIGINATDVPGGVGEVAHKDLAAFLAPYRYFFNPIRYTSLGLAILESMLVGLPVMGMATTELVSVIQPGVNGYITLDPDKLVQQIRRLLDDPSLARRWGQNGRQTALERFHVDRFVRDWERLFAQVTQTETRSDALAVGQ